MFNLLHDIKFGATKESFIKTNFVRQCSLGLAAGLIFFAGCARPSAQPEQPSAVTAPPVPSPSAPVLAQAGPAAPPAVDAAPAPDSTDTNAPVIVERIPPSAQPENVPLSAGLAEVVKLAQAGVGEDVILAYVEKYAARFEVGADQILYLNDLGVSETVITSMLKHDGSPAPAPAVAAAPALIQTQAVSNVPQTQVPEQAPPPVTTAVAPPPTSTEVSYFYDTLSPYGSWIYLSGYGWCWQPTVASSVSTWRPYCDRGRWYWSDAGWYWSSDYSWGWAAFHYGRWYNHPGSGWVWTPGLVWAPSWVSWRYSDGYCGWAPLPPEARFVSGVGFTYYGRNVAVGFDFGLRSHHYSFVSINNFCDYAPYRYVVPHARVQNFYRNTTVINNYIVRNNRTVINHGIGRETIARASQTRVREVSIRETPVSNMARVRGDRIDKEGNQLVVYRPQLPKTPPTVRSAQFANRAGGAGQSGATVGRTANTGVGSAAPAGPSHGGAGRGQSGVARSPGGTRVEPARPPSNVSEERNTPAVTPRGNANSVERGGRNTQPNANPQPARPQRQQPRADGPLFGSGTANTVPPQNNAAARTVEPRAAQPQVSRAQIQPPTQATRVQPQAQTPRVQSQTQPNYLRPAPAYPQPHQPAARGEDRTSGRFSSHATMAPKQQEQLPRYSAPARQAPAASAPQYSRPSTQRAPASQSGGARSAPSGGSGRSEAAPNRGERNR